jgi:hypothetical protein
MKKGNAISQASWPATMAFGLLLTIAFGGPVVAGESYRGVFGDSANMSPSNTTSLMFGGGSNRNSPEAANSPSRGASAYGSQQSGQSQPGAGYGAQARQSTSSGYGGYSSQGMQGSYRRLPQQSPSNYGQQGMGYMGPPPGSQVGPYGTNSRYVGPRPSRPRYQPQPHYPGTPVTQRNSGMPNEPYRRPNNIVTGASSGYSTGKAGSNTLSPEVAQILGGGQAGAYGTTFRGSKSTQESRDSQNEGNWLNRLF